MNNILAEFKKLLDKDFVWKKFNSLTDGLNKSTNCYSTAEFLGLEFNLKAYFITPTAEIPDEVLSKLTHSKIIEIVSLAISSAIEELKEELKKYTWIEEIRLCGNTGGWLALLIDKDLLFGYMNKYLELADLMQKSNLTESEKELANNLLEELQKRNNILNTIFSDLENIKSVIERKISSLQRKISSINFWKKYLE